MHQKSPVRFSYRVFGFSLSLCQLICLFPAPHVEESAREQQKEHDAADCQGDVRLIVDAVARLHLDILALCDRRLEIPGQELLPSLETLSAFCVSGLAGRFSVNRY